MKLTTVAQLSSAAGQAFVSPHSHFGKEKKMGGGAGPFNITAVFFLVCSSPSHREGSDA